MSRINEAIINGKSYDHASTMPKLDLSYGGQQSWAPVLKEWVSNQAYVSRPVIAIVLEVPKFVTLMPDPDKWTQAIKALVEVHSRTIEGLNSALTVDTDTHAVGGAGELQDEIVNVTRARSEVTIGATEKYGRPIQTMIEQWITYGMMDPETKHPLITTIADVPDDQLADWYGMSVLFVEPDPLGRTVNKAWIGVNMFPKETGEISGKKDRTSSQEILDLSIPFTGIYQYGYGVNQTAQKILDGINLDASNPYLRPTHLQDISSDLGKAESGYKKVVEDLGTEATTA